MRSFDEIYAIAAERHGGTAAIDAVLSRPARAEDLKKSMWPVLKAAFTRMDIGRCMMLHDEDFDRLVSDRRIVRHGPKIRSVQENAVFVAELAREQGSAAAVFANWPSSDYVGLLDMLKKRGSRLGGATGQYFLRFMGVDSFILSRDVTARLIAEGVVDKAPSSKRDMAAVQDAFNQWAEQSGRSLTEISQTLARSIG